MSNEITTVTEIGEDSDTWLVTGTSDAHSADEAVRQWVEEHMGATIEAFTDSEDLVEFSIKFRKDWAWMPGPDAENPLDEASLVYPHDGRFPLDQAPFIGPFVGFLVQS
ncbi:hypothetical protein [Glutamicibacter halophytocola]|uniref:hypothetical protein n=1 Tax=Glutamicibacter halophytocola TaxID=1933880 RepID=UPI0015C576EE|nr:hypothetical protein [Glutamicibacter halophytocola]NQD42668.1 hypothetical protein [Glutamicibacter halophytocola]